MDEAPKSTNALTLYATLRENLNMNHGILFVAILLALFCGCSNNPIEKENQVTSRDSLLTKINSLEEVDTTENYYRLLKAYSANDTAYLRNYISDIERYNSTIPPLKFIDSCVRQPNLQDLNVNEAYRFIHRAAFCPYGVNITITRIVDSSKMHFVIYELKDDSIICVNEFNKSLTKKDWNDIVQSLSKNDFWGRRKYNGIGGLDGSELTVIGYKKGGADHRTLYNHVYRWMFLREESLMEPFGLALKLSGNNQGCNWVE
jgi:hypothetical protein